MVESLNIIPIECVNCGTEFNTDFDSVEQKIMLNCPKCGISFHINDIYDMYYDQEPLVKKAVDLIITYAEQRWAITNGKKGYSEAIENFLKKVDFDSLLKEILCDVVKYGDSYLEIIRDPRTKEIIQLKPLESKSVTIKLGKEVQRGRAYTGEREVETFIVGSGTGQRELSPTDVVHSKARAPYSYSPYGEAVMRISLKPINYLRRSREGALKAGAKWWVEYLEDEISLGIGVPRIFLEKNYSVKYSKPVVEIASTYFIGSARNAQTPITSSFEGQLFGQVLGEKDFREIPRLEFQKIYSNKILRNGGYDFSKETKALKELLDAEVISQEEYQRILAEFYGKS